MEKINVDIDPVAEMQHLKIMYIHYKILYRKVRFFMLLRPKENCQSEERRVQRENTESDRKKM